MRPRGSNELFGFLIPPSPNRFALLHILDRGGVAWDATTELRHNGLTYPKGSYMVRMDQPYSSFAKALLEPQNYPNLRDSSGHPISPYDVTAHTLSLLMGVRADAVLAPFRYHQPRPIIGGGGPSGAIVMSKLGVYHSHVPSIDEGWTRWVLKNQSLFQYSSVEDQQVRESNLRTKFNTIIIPDQAPETILNGYKAGTMPAEYTGGLGQAGVKALREFVEQGGTLVCLNRASDFAIEQFHLPLRDVTAELSEKEFFVPGSILRIELDTSHPIAAGMPKETIAWVEDSPVFEVIPGRAGVPLAMSAINRGSSPTVREGSAAEVSASTVRIIARYPSNKDTLLSGWLLGGNRIKGKAALVEVTLGKGRIILFGFRPQYRGQSLATYPLFFNAIRGR